MSLPPFPVIRPEAIPSMNPLALQGFKNWLAIEMVDAAERHRDILHRRVDAPIQYVDPDAAEHRAVHEALTQQERDARRHGRSIVTDGLRQAS